MTGTTADTGNPRGRERGWTRTAERRPTEAYGRQVEVLFGSSGWERPVIGLYAHWSDEEVAAGACRWKLLDQATGMFLDYVGHGEPEPELWRRPPALPDAR